jgi:plasmid maintenance system killer protein
MYIRPIISGWCVMELGYRSRKVQKLCTSRAEMERRLGSAMAAKLAQRISELLAVESLADLVMLPGPRCHELGADRDGQISLDLVHPMRLIIEPADESPPTKADGGLNWRRVTAVVIVEIADTN